MVFGQVSDSLEKSILLEGLIGTVGDGNAIMSSLEKNMVLTMVQIRVCYIYIPVV